MFDIYCFFLAEDWSTRMFEGTLPKTLELSLPSCAACSGTERAQSIPAQSKHILPHAQELHFPCIYTAFVSPSCCNPPGMPLHPKYLYQLINTQQGWKKKWKMPDCSHKWWASDRGTAKEHLEAFGTVLWSFGWDCNRRRNIQKNTALNWVGNVRTAL